MAPIYKENPDNIQNNVSTYSKDNYGFSTIFIIYLIQSIIYLLIHFFWTVLFNPEIFNYDLIAYFVLFLCLFFSFGNISKAMIAVVDAQYFYSYYLLYLKFVSMSSYINHY